VTVNSREVLRKVEEMGFSKEDIVRAVRRLQQTGKPLLKFFVFS
jgi:hypothetical protein